MVRIMGFAALVATGTTLAGLAFAAPAPAAARSGVIETPSGTIVCEYVTAPHAGIDCGIKTGIRPRPPARRCRGGDDAPSFIDLGRTGRATIPVCHGDPGPFLLADRAGVLGYGRTLRWAAGAMRCTSRRTGLTCTNAAHHGFTLSRARTRRF